MDQCQIETHRQQNGLTYVDLTGRVAQFDADPAAVMPLPATGPRRSSGGPAVRAVIRAGDGLTWDQVRIEVGATRTILLKAPGQSEKYVFPPNSQMQEDHPVGMLMTLCTHARRDRQGQGDRCQAPDGRRVPTLDHPSICSSTAD